jgi:hypothetical protein
MGFYFEWLTYVVETIENNRFVFVGTVVISMGEVYKAMDDTGNIADNMPSKFARRQAYKDYPDINPVIVMEIEEWQEKYGRPWKYKRGDIVE